MKHPQFFGYGSLVNLNTHDYPNVRHASLTGWRRVWVRTPLREVAFLSAQPCKETTIDGVVADVPNHDWSALDARERGYERHPVSDQIATESRSGSVSVYSVPTTGQIGSGDHFILLSYLDVVVQGFHQQYGSDGVAAFFESTAGWDTPILNDRDQPRYPRAQTLHPDETNLVDHHLRQLAAHVQQ